MIEALGLEVAAIQKQGGGRRVEVRGGEHVGTAEGSWLYRFVLAEELSLRDDTPVRLESGQRQVGGTIVSTKDGVLVVAVEEDFGPTIPFARLLANSSFLIERLRERLLHVLIGTLDFDTDAANRVIGLGPVRTGDADPQMDLTRGDRRPNSNQVEAIRRSLGSDTTYVWGPPGTGKTTTLASIVEAHYRAGRSVLLVSNTNIAVDTALEKVAESLQGEPEFHQGLVIRRGPVVKEELRQRFGSQVVLEEIVARLAAPLLRKKEDLTRQAERLEREKTALETAIKELTSLQALARRRQDLQQSLKSVEAKCAANAEEARSHQRSANSLRNDLERAKTMGAFRRFLSGLSLEVLERQIGVEQRAAQACTEAALAMETEAQKYRAKAGRLEREIRRLQTSTHDCPPLEDAELKVAALSSSLDQLRSRISSIEAEIADIQKDVIARCRILATTVYRTYLGKDIERRFDVVVIDEASMLPPPLVYFVAGLSKQSITVAGDFRQLPPIVQAEAPLATEWLKCDVFEKAGISRCVALGETLRHMVHLGTQYRMRTPICEIINKLFYSDAPLRSGPTVDCTTDEFPLGQSALLYVDTSAFNPWSAAHGASYSRYNILHALLVRSIVLRLAQTDVLPPEGEPNTTIGAIAPYAAQAQLIQALLDDRLGERAAGIAATVHRFQGNEKRAIVLDLTDAPGTPISRFMKATRIEDDGARLMNVALSRARYNILLLGHFGHLRDKAPTDALVVQVIDYFEENGMKLNPEKILSLAEDEWVDALHQVLPPDFEVPEGAAGFFDEGSFYPAFSQDIVRAKQSVVILSPFMTERGTSRWIELIRAALSNGARACIVTRPPRQPEGEVAQVIGNLRGLGITVELRARMHQKIAVLDGSILWHGSLNILSHTNTSESMIRLRSQTACQRISKFLSVPG